MKISSQYREQRNGRTILRVLEVKKEIRAYDGCPLALVLGRVDSVFGLRIDEAMLKPAFHAV